MVLENIPSRPDYHKLIEEASTCDNQDLRDYLSQYTFLVKEENTEDHWLAELPAEVLVVIEKSAGT